MVETKFISESSERNLLKCILKSEEKLIVSIEELKPEHFGFKYCNEIFNTVLSIFEKGEKIIHESLIHNITEFCREYLIELLKEPVEIENFKTYLSIIKDKYFLRQSNIISDSIKESINKGVSGYKLIDLIQEDLNDLTNNTTSEIFSFGNNLFDSIPNPDIYNPENKKKLDGIVSGIKELDSNILEFYKGCYTVLGGRPSQNKSLLLRQIFIYNALQGVPVLLFSIDEPTHIIKRKVVSTITGINYNHLKKEELNNEELKILKRYLPVFQDLPFFIDESTNITISIIRAKIKKMLYKYGKLGAVGVDYVQQIGITTEELSRFSLGIKHLTKEFSIPFFIVSQLSRGIENRATDKDEKWSDPPLLSDLKQSSALESDADKVIFIKAEPVKHEDGMFKEKRKTRLWIMKQRDGISSIYVDLYSIGNVQRLVVIDKELGF